MRLCDSEENRRKLAWLVPGYILLAWFFCVVFQVDGYPVPNVKWLKNNAGIPPSSRIEVVEERNTLIIKRVSPIGKNWK